MTLELSIGPFHRIRVFTEPPYEMHHQRGRSLAVSFPASAPGPTDARFVAIESRRIVGPRALYGLIGGWCLPDGARDCVQVTVEEVSQSDTIPTAWTLGAEQDDIRFGLTNEYASVVLRSAEDSLFASRLGGCNVAISYCASSAVNSSAEVFRRLSIAAFELFCAPIWPPVELDTVAALQRSRDTHYRDV